MHSTMTKIKRKINKKKANFPYLVLYYSKKKIKYSCCNSFFRACSQMAFVTDAVETHNRKHNMLDVNWCRCRAASILVVFTPFFFLILLSTTKKKERKRWMFTADALVSVRILSTSATDVWILRRRFAFMLKVFLSPRNNTRSELVCDRIVLYFFYNKLLEAYSTHTS
jgi:hypothetical protein